MDGTKKAGEALTDDGDRMDGLTNDEKAVTVEANHNI
jgi:hypothetical protein